MIAAMLALTSLLNLQAATSETAPPAESANTAPAGSDQQQVPPANVVPEEPTPVPPPPPPPLLPRRYGDAGTSEIAIGLGYWSGAGFLGAGGFRYFVVDGVAPGLEATYDSGGNRFSAFGMVMGSLRVVPFRTGGFALVLTGRAGRVLLAHHSDGWGAGGGAGVIVFLGANVGLELGYEVLRLLPDSFCADLDGCVIQRPVVGLRLAF